MSRLMLVGDLSAVFGSGTMTGGEAVETAESWGGSDMENGTMVDFYSSIIVCLL
jgi:hypothetical protein